MNGTSFHFNSNFSLSAQWIMFHDNNNNNNNNNNNINNNDII